MWLISWPKTTCATKSGGHEDGATATDAGSCLNSSSSQYCTCLGKLVRKLKKHRRKKRGGSSRSSQSSYYDPLSYSLNFDTSGCGNLFDDQDYFKFYAFSSRFVANPSAPGAPSSPCPTS